MKVTRRSVIIGLSTVPMAGCLGGNATQSAAGAWPSVRNPAFDAWVRGFRARAARAGISAQTLSQGLRGVGYLPGVIERDRNQTEFKRSLEDYLAIAASDERVAKGRSQFSARSRTLQAIEARYGVEAEIVCAVWGLESRYGERRGDAPVISALATLAFDGRRGSFFEKQLVAALKIIQNGDISAARMTGSWAGAMGHTQFIPTSYQAFAVDFDGDGRRDIWSADPSDALASTAAYLQRNGWRTGQPWGLEVLLPNGFSGPTGRGNARSAAQWRAAGVRRADGRALPDHGPGSILTPSGRSGPAFLVYRNFRVLLSYNNAENYAIGVGHLSDRITGGNAISGTFPPDAFGFTIEDRKALQRGLNRAGFDAGEPDGVFGSKTETAIRAFQKARGLTQTGKPSRALLELLK